MAEIHTPPQRLGWGQLPDGRFFLNTEVQIPASGGKVVQVPTMTFVLTEDEKAALIASLTGLQVIAAPSKLLVNGKH